VLTFRLGPDLLGHTRFAFSPIAEVASALHLLAGGQPSGVHQPWVRAARVAARDVDLPLLTALVPCGRWLPDFLFQPAEGPHTTFATQLEALEAGGVGPVIRDLTAVWEDRPMPVRLRAVLERGEPGLHELTGALAAFWQCAVAPYWPRVRAVLEDDVAHRAGRLVADGLYELLADLHAEVSVVDAELRIDKPQHSCARYDGTRLVLVPSVFVYPHLVVLHDRAGDVVLTYGARGVARTWEALGTEGAGADHLAALLGRTRATILALLAVPMTTSQLADELGQSLGTVSEHLGRLRASGLLTSWRVGRRVYYRQTPLAATLLDVGTSGAEEQSAG
jgi:DNA-binding transcriptional ArsR family regulator